MEKLFATSNIANKVRNTRLPRTKPLMPLFEVVSNSIHSIQESIKEGNLIKGKGKITILCIRNGKEETLQELPDIDRYPIHSFEISDNGIGLNKENLTSFVEADTDHKLKIGGKGIGRFVCLKAFKVLNISSQFLDEQKKEKTIAFDFKSTKEGFENFSEPKLNGRGLGTTVRLTNYREEYQKNLEYDLQSIARELIAHFQLYFIRKQVPTIIVRNQNNIEFDLTKLFALEFKSEVEDKDFYIEEEKFTLYLTKSLKIQSHKIHYCAHNRSVINEGLYSLIVDLGKYSIKDNEGNRYYYQAYVVGDILDEFVDTERIGFNFPDGNDLEDEESFDLNLAKLRRASVRCIEEILKEYLAEVRNHKVESYRPTINEELPQYRSTLNYRKEEILKLPPDLPKDKLDIELYKIDAKWRLEVKEHKIELLEEKKDVTNHEEYVLKYEKFLSEFNEIGKSDLARYVVHRKTIIELLEGLIEKNENDKFENEDLIHSVFFPIRSNSDEITADKQNLWLIDERLTYHSFLASDKTFKSVSEVSADQTQRSDLLIYNEAFAFSDSKNSPHNSFTIVEFKKPMRDDYKDYDEDKNPIEQTEKYIDNLLDGKVKSKNGRTVEVSEKTPFYIYIVCDVTPTLEKILKRREFEKTPDGKGYFKVKSKYYSAYFEVLPFEKVLDDARKRNRILFEKLNIE
ncbi:Histidine kinase-, DNA gyrase B-, and HSP90-like ATPase [Flaviramulus basaltis]|uniref:Histidine kinase-, DNA gyrase B-, and HSP90-like ATPase n=1 Tax=Flaviramulus basaltis TaxID=369401 RepID=A0A1K2IRS4_9FLAO|nr:ATP-binding protein [Flaviramulus basaltis]SFZ94419.1 Histidine kinase-, DNA gyrase B-, and HSP90-like ATPase [Flaviramulus basaltis]